MYRVMYLALLAVVIHSKAFALVLDCTFEEKINDEVANDIICGLDNSAWLEPPINPEESNTICSISREHSYPFVSRLIYSNDEAYYWHDSPQKHKELEDYVAPKLLEKTPLKVLNFHLHVSKRWSDAVEDWEMEKQAHILLEHWSSGIFTLFVDLQSQEALLSNHVSFYRIDEKHPVTWTTMQLGRCGNSGLSS